MSDNNDLKNIVLELDAGHRPWFNELLTEAKCHIESTLWVSQCNKYVQYDYEPYCTVGFSVRYTIAGEPNHLKYFRYLFNNVLKAAQGTAEYDIKELIKQL